MGHRDGETGLEKLKETLKGLDFSSKLIKVSMYNPNMIRWYQKDDTLSAPELLSLGSCEMHMLQDWESVHLMGVRQTCQELLQHFQKIIWRMMRDLFECI